MENQKPTIEDVLSEIQELRQEVKQAMDTFNETIKKTTQETSTATITPPEKSEVAKEADNPLEGKQS